MGNIISLILEPFQMKKTTSTSSYEEYYTQGDQFESINRLGGVSSEGIVFKMKEQGKDYACKVFHPSARKPNTESDAMKEFRIMMELAQTSKHILKPVRMVQGGSVAETNERTGQVNELKGREIIVSE